jgi:Protein of unknown function (DUF4058)
MASPFPGMDPYIENPATWPNLHSRLIVAIANHLAPQLRPTYRVVVEEAVYKNEASDSTVLIGVPDVTIRQANQAVQPTATSLAVAEAPITVTLPMPATVRQRYLEIRAVQTSEVITVIEILSPVNKRPGSGRQKYESKRLEILESATNLVEIDLLHRYEPMPISQGDRLSHYRILISPSDTRPKARLYPFDLQQALPTFMVPLRSDSPEIAVDLQHLLSETYDLSGYDLDIDYCQMPQPTWPKTELDWIDSHLRSKSLR